MTSLKGVSSMKLHRDVGVTQKTAWLMLQRLREAFKNDDEPQMGGPVEVDETYLGGKRWNMSKTKREKLTGRGPVGKTTVVSARDRKTNRVVAGPVQSVDRVTL